MDDVTVPRDSNEKVAGDDGINLADYLGVIAKHRRIIFRICAAAVIITAIVSFILPKSYSATAAVVPPIDVLQKEAGIGGGLGGIKSDLLRKAMDGGSIAELYVGILKSRSIADAVIERFDLSKIYKIKNNFSAVRQVLRKRTSIEVSNEGIINITVEDRDRDRAAAIANAYIDELDRQNKRLFVGQATSKKVFLENRLKEIQTELSNIENIPSREAKIKEMLFELLTREFEVAKIEEAKSMPTIQVLDTAIVPEKKCKPRRKQMVIAALAVSFFLSVVVAFVREHFAQSPSFK